MTKHPDLFTALAAPFEPDEVKQRTAGGNRNVHYVTARTVMNRLDSVLGPENWWDEYTPGENSVLCRLTVRMPDGQLLTKADAGGYAGMSDEGDDDKSGYSDAFKRAAVKFGVGRYLYRDGIPSFVGDAADKFTAPAGAIVPMTSNGHANGRANGQSNGKQRHDWPGASEPAIAAKAKPAQPAIDGRGLFKWLKDAEQRHGVGLLKYMNNWGKIQEFNHTRIVDWSPEQAALGLDEAKRKLASIGHAN